MTKVLLKGLQKKKQKKQAVATKIIKSKVQIFIKTRHAIQMSRPVQTELRTANSLLELWTK